MVKKIIKKGMKTGLKKGKELAVKVDEKAQISKKIDEHKKEIIGITVLFGAGFTIGFILGHKKKKVSLFERIQKKKRKMKRDAQMKALMNGMHFIVSKINQKKIAA